MSSTHWTVHVNFYHQKKLQCRSFVWFHDESDWEEFTDDDESEDEESDDYGEDELDDDGEDEPDDDGEDEPDDNVEEDGDNGSGYHADVESDVANAAGGDDEVDFEDDYE